MTVSAPGARGPRAARRCTASLAALAALAAAAAAGTGGPPRFAIVSLEPLGSAPLTASALNDAGQATGVVFHQVGGQNRAFPFVWSKKKGLRELQPPSGHTGASATDINAQGEVVGFLTHPSFGLRGYRWRTAPLLRSQVAPYQVFPELQDRLPLAVSDNGRTIAGQGFDAQDPAWVFDAQTGQVTDLIVGGIVVEGVNDANAVNAAGIVVGTISTRLANGSVRPHAFRYTPGFAGWFIELLPGPTNPWYWTDASDVNDAGDIVGFVFDDLDQSAATWDVTGNFTDLGLASPSEFVTLAKAVNEDGWIVGWSPNDHPLGLDTPFLWIDGTFYDLNDLVDGVGGTTSLVGEDAGFVYRAHDVNDSGMILAEIVHFSPALRFEDVLLVPKP